MRNAEYIGDGVYVHQNDYGQIGLTTGHHDPDQATNHIVMEPEVLAAFLRWVEARKAEAGKTS